MSAQVTSDPSLHNHKGNWRRIFSALWGHEYIGTDGPVPFAYPGIICLRRYGQSWTR